MKKRLKLFIIMFALSAITLSVGINNVYADETYTNYDPKAGSITCGGISGIPSILPRLVSVIYLIIQIAIPVLLVILGMIDLFKAITANKEDDINKSRGIFFKRLISAVLVFFVLTVVKILVSALSGNSNNITKCLDCFISNECAIETTVTCNFGGYEFKVKNGKFSFANEDSVRNGYYIGKSEFEPTTNQPCPSESEYKLQSIPNSNGYNIIAK